MTIGKVRHGRGVARIVVDARTLRGDPGGVASYTEALIEHLPAVLPEVPIVLLRHPLNPRALSRAPNVTEWAENQIAPGLIFAWDRGSTPGLAVTISFTLLTEFFLAGSKQKARLPFTTSCK